VKALLPEALPSIVANVTTTAITLVAYSAMAGLVGGGGLGYLADAYGYKRFDLPVLIAATILLILIVQIFQVVGDRISRRLDHRSIASGRATGRKVRLNSGTHRDTVAGASPEVSSK
ncbi:MAG: hypothetical protein GX814_01710, partial [Microbacteriaceae bacterium]|nr:hypothetical protein [Microbacteriaceae bacterium]